MSCIVIQNKRGDTSGSVRFSLRPRLLLDAQGMRQKHVVGWQPFAFHS